MSELPRDILTSPVFWALLVVVFILWLATRFLTAVAAWYRDGLDNRIQHAIFATMVMVGGTLTLFLLVFIVTLGFIYYFDAFDARSLIYGPLTATPTSPPPPLPTIDPIHCLDVSSTNCHDSWFLIESSIDMTNYLDFSYCKPKPSACMLLPALIISANSSRPKGCTRSTSGTISTKQNTSTANARRTSNI
ncbi:hypothetical protein K469DRAFT_797509 [Zopfia rhizophila CBS 207.26]|uniref:Uncharacterized protein n=1 Tax=Zopfia rhizophila CBS 207.26 TaxID=1314779 RepID=A0A6A6DLW3_9PEZI|nr:hypothetical protein K469DRAFT_797509 [Zopfia rhizophila CBS 207.26]